MKKALPVILFAVLIAVFIGGVPNVHAQSGYFTSQGCAGCHVGQTGSNYCGMCHAHGVHSSSGKNNINVTGTTNKSTYAPGENVSVTVSGGYRPSAARAILYDQNSAVVDISTGTGAIPVNAPQWPVTLSASAPATPGTYTWKVAWYGNQYDSGGAAFGNGSNGSQWTPDPGNANHGWETVSLASFVVVGASTPQIGVAPASKAFGDVTVGSSSSQVFTISNAGTADLVVSGIALTTGTLYSVAPGGSNACPSLTPTILAGNNCTIQVTFSPLAAGSNITDTLVITSNDTGNSPLDVPLAGNGTAPPASTPDIAVSDSVPPANDLQIPFGSVTVGTSGDQTVTVSNAGNDNLVIGTIAQANPLATPFTILNDTCSGKTLAPAANCTLTARFSPNATTSFSDSFDIPSNDPDEDPVTVSVSGTGTGAPVPDITVTDSVAPANDLQVPFGNVLQNSSSDQTVTITNSGTASLVIGTVASVDGLAAPFSIPAGTDNCSGVTLAPSVSCTISVRFAPTALGAASDTFDIPSDDPDEDPVTVTINGTGVANNPPEASALVLPVDGATGLDPASVTFEWNRSTDPEGDTVTYNLFVCTDETFASCPDPIAAPITAAAGTRKGFTYAASGAGIMFFGIAFAAGISRRRKVALLLALALIIGLLFVACSDDNAQSTPRGQVGFTATNLAPATTYFWKVVATDGTGSTDSATRSFTTK
jgi:hypothetical protein